MKFNIQERLLVTQLYPKQSNRLTMKAVQAIDSKVGFSAEEIKKYNMVQTDKGFSFSLTTDTFELELSTAELELLKKEYLALDKAGAITIQLYALGERICDEIGEEKV